MFCWLHLLRKIDKMEMSVVYRYLGQIVHIFHEFSLRGKKITKQRLQLELIEGNDGCTCTHPVPLVKLTLPLPDQPSKSLRLT